MLWDCVCALSHVQLFVNQWTAACWVPLFSGFSRQEYWSGLPWPHPGESSWPRDQTPASYGSCLAGRFFTAEPPGKPPPVSFSLVAKIYPKTRQISVVFTFKKDVISMPKKKKKRKKKFSFTNWLNPDLKTSLIAQVALRHMNHDVDTKFEIMKVKIKTRVYIKNSRTVLAEKNFLMLWKPKQLVNTN